MECQERTPQLALYVEGSLPGAESRELEDHLAGCARCQRELENWRLLEGALRSLPVTPEPVDLKSSVMQRLQQPIPLTAVLPNGGGCQRR